MRRKLHLNVSGVVNRGTGKENVESTSRESKVVHNTEYCNNSIGQRITYRTVLCTLRKALSFFEAIIDST